MIIELNDEEVNNVKVCIVNTAKMPNVTAEAMKLLLQLSDKFVEKKETPVEKEPSIT